RGLPQLFAVDPARGPVLHPRLLVAVGRDGELVAPVRVADPEVAVAVERPEPAVRRLRRLVLPAALRPAAPAQRRTLRRSPRRGRPARRDVVTVVRALPHVLEGATVLGPRHVQRTQLHRPGDLRGHRPIAGVTRHRPETVLRAERRVQHGQQDGNDRGRTQAHGPADRGPHSSQLLLGDTRPATPDTSAWATAVVRPGRSPSRTVASARPSTPHHCAVPGDPTPPAGSARPRPGRCGTGSRGPAGCRCGWASTARRRRTRPRRPGSCTSPAATRPDTPSPPQGTRSSR